MKLFSEFNKQTGLFTSQVVRGTQPNDTEATAWMPGRFDHRTQRIDVETRQVVSYTPVPVADTQREKRRALALIADLERRQARPIRELRLDPDNAEARQRLAAIDAEIAKLRSALNGETETTERGRSTNTDEVIE